METTEGASDEVIDLQQKLAILQAKRHEDKARLKELEKYRIQVQQVYTLCAVVHMQDPST